MSARGTCSTCLAARYVEQTGITSLYCHRRAPQVVLLPSTERGRLSIAGLWPPVEPNEGCEEWEQDPASTVKVASGGIAGAVRDALAHREPAQS